ncbi:hypothetical protein [Planktothricoides sp. SR001]|nr:hypothetical protein [Planktothricoides sp. SR001]
MACLLPTIDCLGHEVRDIASATPKRTPLDRKSNAVWRLSKNILSRLGG